MVKGVRFIDGKEFLLAGRYNDRDQAGFAAAELSHSWRIVKIRKSGVVEWSLWVHDSLTRTNPSPPDDWDTRISALRILLSKVGPLWPSSTQLSGYAAHGPYHCGHCRYLIHPGRCNQPVVLADEQVPKDSSGLAIVDDARGCCEFVDPGKEK